MSSLIHPLRAIFANHLSDNDLTLFLGDELPLAKRRNAETHFATCSQCRKRYEALDMASCAVAQYCDAFAETDSLRARSQRDLLLVRLNRLIRNAAFVPRLMQRRPQSTGISLPTMNPTLATAALLALASIVFVSIWIQQSKPGITSNALLVRAEAWDASSANPNAGVICQKVAIRTAQHRVYRTIYRDAHGLKKPKLQQLSYEDDQLRTHLSSAGVSWDTPLSATNFQDWHDHQRVRQDQIARSGKNLLVLTTTVPDGVIAEQSFTVRDSDFHPIERTVVFRDSQTIEIAELEYQVLPWKRVDDDLFDPAGSPVMNRVVALQPTLVPKMPLILSPEQLDESELSARLVLNQFHADTGEQIKLERGPQGIEIKGLVETDERKRELQQQLRFIPHATIAILSIEELRKTPEAPMNGTNTQVTSGEARRSPLEAYFIAQGRNPASLSDFSHQLVDSALTIDRESRAISELIVRFGSADKMTDLASATLAELVFSHRERLFSALEKEQKLLDQARANGNSKLIEAPGRQADSLITAAGKNLALCKDLTLGGGAPARGADAILSDLALAMNDVRSSARQAKLSQPNSFAADGKK